MIPRPLRPLLKRLYTFARVWSPLPAAWAYRAQWRAFRRQAAEQGARFALEPKDRLPFLSDATEGTPFDAHYIYHTAWAARRLAALKPARHVDIGSSLYFAALGSAIAPMDFYDYRPPALALEGLTCGRADLLGLPFPGQSVPSLSCMHVVEHVGLGRYGDPLDYDGDLKACRELARVLAPGGRLLFVVPVGRARVQFNAHRVYDPRLVEGMFPGLKLEAFSLLDDFGAFTDGASLEKGAAQSYGCGCFVLVRP
jgi:SAM-dependent methyltransferase